MPSRSIRDLRIFTDNDVTMRSQVTQTVSGCFALLRQLCSIRRSLPDSVFQSLVVALVMPRLDYGNATLAGLPICVLAPSTTIGSQYCSQDDTPVITSRTHHTTTARSTLAAVSGAHRLQVGSACFSMPERSRSKIPL